MEYSMKKTILAMGLVLLSSVALADKGSFVTDVKRVFTSNPNVFGGCMADVGRRVGNATDNPTDCTTWWVSFSCSGEFNPKETAYKMYDAAQISVALGTQLRIWVDDTKKHNGHCVAERVDILASTD